MAVDITIDGKPYWNADSYAVTEDSTPIDPSDSTGGVGQFTFSVPEDADSKTFRNKVVTLTDGTQGVTEGIVRGLSGDGTTVVITADSRVGALMVTRTAQPYVGTLGGAFRYYLGLVGVTDGIAVDTTIENIPVVFQGWSGVVWDYTKKMVASQRVEVSLVSDNIVLRPLRGRIAQNYRDSAVSWAIDASNLAQSIEVYYYQGVQRTSALVYPPGGWSENVDKYQIGAGETQTYDITLMPQDAGPGASVTSIQQPTCVASVDRDYAASSVYSVAGNDGLIIPPQQWLDGGGSVTAKINPDTTSITLTIVGSNDIQYAPYRIIMPSDTSDGYSSLRLVGSGVFVNKQLTTWRTGVNADATPTEVGATVDVPFINTYAEAAAVAAWTLGAHAAPKQSLTVTTTGINRLDDNGSYSYSTMMDANVEYAGLTMGQVNAIWPDAAMGEVSAYWKAKTQDDFVNQAFGNIAGARVFNDGALYRIRSVPTAGPATIQYAAELDVVASDLNARYAGLTMGEVNALRSGESFADFNTAPVRN